MMGSVHVEGDEVLVCFDVSSLFTIVPVDVIHEKLREDETLGTGPFFPRNKLQSYYFSYGGNLYMSRRKARQSASPVSAVVANLYMEFFEELALETAPTRPRLWKRYVGDAFCIIRKRSTKELLRHLKGVRSTIKFTVG